ncbi:MAG: amino acid permease [Acidimicrobiales bacterium]|nr:amino acid permease [Acidimicrobiales bacterium]
MPTDPAWLDEDERRLAELGYRQELGRSWSGFSNFAISFSIISILAGCFTTFGQAWNNGGPVAMSIGWPVISAFILLIGLCMSELVSAYPTSGGIYYWAAKLGGPKACFDTGWLNVVGNVAVLASVAYGCATFIDLTLSTYNERFAESYSLARVFALFVLVLAVVAVVNIFRSHLLAVINDVSVWWHVAGAAAVVLILVLLPDRHQSVSWVFTTRIDNSATARICTGCWCCRWGSCSPSTRSPATTPRRTCRRRRPTPPPRPPGASGRPSSTRRWAVGCCCWPSCSQCRTRRR